MATPAIPVNQSRGLLRVVSNDQISAAEEKQAADNSPSAQEPHLTQLASHIRARLTEFRNHRTSERIDERLLDALRTYRGQYDAQKLAEIRKFQGSDVYARLTAMKCRGTTALLRDVYLGSERPWEIGPTPVPVVPDGIDDQINQLVNIEVATLQQSGQQIDQQMVADRVKMLRKEAKRVAKKLAIEQATAATNKLDDILWEGGFYTALADFLVDLPIFPYAAIKGPVIKNVNTLSWVNGKPVMQAKPKMFWYRVSPFDLYISPGAQNAERAEIIEKIQLTRAELLQLRDLPGYNKDAIDAVLSAHYQTGLREWWSGVESERRDLEDRERWPRASSGLIDTIEYHGSVSGKTLLDWGMPPDKVPDPLQEYMVTAWLIDRWVIKAQLNPSPRQRHPYYLSSFEKVPGSPIGNGLPDILDDIQNVANATLRALVNNLSIASGPQAVINDEVLAPGETDDMYPWKRWHVRYDPMNVTSGTAPITFFQPNSNSQELLGVYERFSQLADEISAIPRYMMGNEKVGGAGRTASGLAMMMGNASKVLQNVAANIDRDIMQPMLETLYDYVMLTEPGDLRGDEEVIVKGVGYAVKREQDRMRQMEFLQMTANPIDMGIVGVEGRANVLRNVSAEIGLDHEKIVPAEDELRQRMQQMQQQAAIGPPPGQQPGPKDQRAAPEQVRQQSGAEQMFANNGQSGSRTPVGG